MPSVYLGASSGKGSKPTAWAVQGEEAHGCFVNKNEFGLCAADNKEVQTHTQMSEIDHQLKQDQRS